MPKLYHISTTKGGSNREIFGLKNFGGPALNLRVYARVKTEFGVFDAHLIRNYETVNMDNGEFVPLSIKELKNANQQEEGLLNLDSLLSEDSQKPVLELFYTFESVSGRGHPSNLRNPTKKSMEDIVSMYDSRPNWKPKQVRLDEIRNRAVEKRDASGNGVQLEKDP